MKANEGQMDRALRVAVGGVMVALTLAGGVGAWGWIGVVPLVTGLVGFCPIYKLIGRNTRPRWTL